MVFAGCALEPQQRTYVPNKQNTIAAYNPNSYDSAAARFKARANAGDPVAMYNLGRIYADGRGVVRNDKLALSWITKSAKAGYSNAQVELGVDYCYGKGVAKNIQAGCQWLAQAARAGNRDGLKLHQKLC